MARKQPSRADILWIGPGEKKRSFDVVPYLRRDSIEVSLSMIKELHSVAYCVAYWYQGVQFSHGNLLSRQTF
jgi:hypothetical protein